MVDSLLEETVNSHKVFFLKLQRHPVSLGSQTLMLSVIL
jgi:hypothetical protein